MLGYLDCYWVGSLDVTFLGNQVGFSTNPPPKKKNVKNFLQGRCSNQGTKVCAPNPPKRPAQAGAAGPAAPGRRPGLLRSGLGGRAGGQAPAQGRQLQATAGSFSARCHFFYRFFLGLLDSPTKIDSKSWDPYSNLSTGGASWACKLLAGSQQE